MHANHLSSIDHIPLNYFDVVVLVTVLIGAKMGRKHGMSEEIMGVLQWVAIIFAGAFLYRPLGDKLALSSPISHLFCYITIYVATAIVTKIAFSLLTKSMGGKLMGSDVFGGAEYYLGMVAGAVRYSCMLLAVLAILNAPYYSKQDVSAAQAFQNDVYGSNFFPELSSVQQEVFKDSMVGSLIKKRASIMLIASTKKETVAIKRRKDDLP